MLSSLPLVQAAVIADPIRDLTAIFLAVLIGIGLIARAPAARWTALIVALLVAPLLLAGAVLDDDRVNALFDRPVLLLAGAAAGLIALVVAVVVLVRWPNVLPVAIAVAIPLRLPLTIGDESVNLLLPLYGLIGAGVVAFAVRARRRGKALERSWDLRTGPTAGEQLAEAWSARSLSGAAAAVPVLLAASVAIYALRIPFSIDADRGVQTLCFFLVPFAALYVVLREVEWSGAQLRRVAVALAVLGLVAVALGDYEYLTGKVLWHENVIDESSLNATIRVNSLFFDPNIYGRFLMVLLLGVLSALAWGARGARIVGLAVLFALLWTGLFVTYSQSSMLGLLVGAVVLLGLRFGRGKAFAVGAAIVVVGVVAVVAFGGFLRVSNAGTTQGADNITSGRWSLIKGGAELIADKPVFGWGSGGYRSAYRQQTDANAVGTVAASHTIPITVAAEQGIIGLAIYVALIAAALVALLRKAATSAARAAIGAAFAGLVIHSWLYAAFLEDPFTWALLAVGLSLGAEFEGRESTATIETPTGAGASGSGPGRSRGRAESSASRGAAAAAAGAAVGAGAARGASEAVGARPAPQPDVVRPTRHSPHDVVGPVTLVQPGEGAGPGAAIGESGRPPQAADGGHGAPVPKPGDGGTTGPQVGEGAGPAAAVGESGLPPQAADGGHGAPVPHPGDGVDGADPPPPTPGSTA